MTKFTIVLTMLLLVGHASYSQSFHQSSLTWSADQAIDLERGDTTNMKCSFRTSGAGQFVWSQRNGTINSTYEVTGVEGSWGDVNAPGSVTLSLRRNGKNAKAVIERTMDGASLILEFAGASATTHIKFRITNVD